MSQTFPFSLVQNANSVTNPSPQSAQNHSMHPSATSVQPAQQMAFQANAQLPSTDMSALLQNISPEQLAVIGHLFQTGQLQLPAQPPPPVAQPSSNAVVAPIQPAATAASGDMDIDKEEGEWDEGEIEVPKERDFLRPPPSGPRKRSASPGNDRNRYGMDSRSGRNFPSRKQQKKDGAISRNEIDSTNASSVVSGQQVAHRQAKREAAKKFVTAAYRAGFDFDDFAREVGDATSLRSLFRELDLEMGPSHRGNTRRAQANSTGAPTPPVASRLNGVGANHTTVPQLPDVSTSNPQTSVPKRPTPAKPVTVKPATAKPAGTADRQAYLAKLQAAKNKSANAPAPDAVSTPVTPSVVSPPTMQMSTTPSLGVEAATSLNPAATNATPPVVQQPRRANVNTDLVRQRLEALRRDQALRELARAAVANTDTAVSQQPLNATVQGESTSQRGPPPTQLDQSPVPFYNPISAPQAAPSIDTNISPVTATSSAPFPGLPGLFMSGSPFQARAAGQTFPGLGAPPARPQIQPVAPSNSEMSSAGAQGFTDPQSTIMFNMPAQQSLHEQPTSCSSTPVSGRPSGYRPFRSGHSSDDDKVIIQASDDEESVLSEGKDEDPERTHQAGPVINTTKPGSLPNFPSAMHNGHAGLGNSGSMTPGSRADTLTMEAKIAAMHLKIAYLEKQREAKAKQANVTAPQSTRRTDAARGSAGGEGATAAALEQIDNERASRMPGDNSRAMAANGTHPNPAAAAADDQQRKEEIEDMEAQVAQLERETGLSQQRVASAQAHENGVSDGGVFDKTGPAATSNDGASTSSSDDAMDVSSDDDDDDDDDVQESNQTANSNPNLEEEDEDDDTYDPAELENLEGNNDHAPTSQGVADVTTVTPTESQVASDGDYTNAFLNDESIIMSPSQNAQARDDVPQHQGDFSTDSSLTSSSESDDAYEPEPIPQDVAMGETGIPPPATTVVQPVALPGLGGHVATDDLISRSGPKNSEGDLAPELQPSGAGDLPTVEKPESVTRPRSFFTPYKSPLTAFKDYRYHPEFSQTVSGGFKSLTYSNKLNPNLVLCPRETAEGECHEQGCDYQHFRGMAVNDNELLKELGTRNIPNKTPEDDKRWKEGLTKVVQSLRASNQGKDVNAIAARIAQFRREFVGRPDSVLSLDLA